MCTCLSTHFIYFNNNNTCFCPTASQVLLTTGLCQLCPSIANFSVNTCTCPTGNYYNQTSNTCICSSGLVLQADFTCVSCPVGMSNIGNSSCECTNVNFTYQNTNNTCNCALPNQVILTSGQCSVCPTIANISYPSCTCPLGNSYDQTNNIC